MLMLELSLSSHNMDVTEDQFDEATDRSESQSLEQQIEGVDSVLSGHQEMISEVKVASMMLTSSPIESAKGKDIPSEREINQRFRELWHEKGELLLYKAFVSRFPNCALWYDQIVGSIPPVVEVEVITSEIFDSHTNRSNKEHSFGEACYKERECCGTKDQGNVYSSGSIKEHVYSCANSTEHVYSIKEHNNSNWDESRREQTSSRECKRGEFDISESRFNVSVIGEEHICSASKKEHLHIDKNNREQVTSGENNIEHIHLETFNIEQSQQRDSDREICYQGFSVTKTLNESSSTQHCTYQDSNVQGNVLHSTNVEKQLFSNSNKRIINNSDAEEEVCNEASSTVISELDQNGSSPEELPEAREVTLKNGLISEADVQTGGNLTEAGNCSFLNGNGSDSGLSCDGNDSFVHDVTSFAGSTTNTVSVNDSISCIEKELVLQLPQYEHIHTPGNFNDHGYTNRTHVSSLSGDCEDSFDGQDGGEDYGHGELIARLQEAHEDLKNQIFSYVRGIFTEWVRRNPHEEFDICSLDRDLLAVADASMEDEFVIVEYTEEP